MYSTGAAAAFTADSFVIDTNPYLFESIQASNFSLRDSATTFSTTSTETSTDRIDLVTAVPELLSSPSGTLTGIFDSGAFEGQPYVMDVSLNFSAFSVNSAGNNVSSSSYTVPTKDNVTFSSLVFPTSFDISYDVSPLNSSSLEFGGVFAFFAQVYSGSTFNSTGYSLDVYIDDVLYKSYKTASRYVDFGGWIYNGSSPVSSVKFSITPTPLTASVSSGLKLTAFIAIHNSCTAYIAGLSGDSVLDGFNNSAQDAMNQQDAIESQWTGSMTENFNNLSLSDFTFPVAAVNGFSLISGIFNDLWNAMGDFRIVYVFPLTLGVVLLLIGRLSRTSVKRSSGRGDDDA